MLPYSVQNLKIHLLLGPQSAIKCPPHPEMKTKRGEKNAHGCKAWLPGEVMQLYNASCKHEILGWLLLVLSCSSTKYPAGKSLEVVKGIGMNTSRWSGKEQVPLPLRTLLWRSLHNVHRMGLNRAAALRL